MAAQYGLEKNDSLELSDKLYAGVNIFKEENRETAFKFEQLPVSCSDSADAIEKDRSFFEKNKVFPKGTIDRFINKLRSYKDKNLREELFGKDDEIKKLVLKYMHHM